MIHPARTIPFNELVAGLQAANDNGLVSVQVSGELRQYTYTQTCNFDRAWTPITELARGLIVSNDNVVATPFSKFFNLGERDTPIPDLPFEIFEKVDGSLIIAFHHGGQWQTATKGSFKSDQAIAARKILHSLATESLSRDHTYLFEYVGPDNRIVVHYDKQELVLLAVYNGHGWEYDYEGLKAVGQHIGVRVAERYAYSSISELLATAATMPATQEGFVLRFANGYRLKIKGDEYCRLHRLVSRVTPLCIWEMFVAGDDLDSVRKELPEEFWKDFDAICNELSNREKWIRNMAAHAYNVCLPLSDKEVGLSLKTWPEDVRHFIFPLRKGHDISKAVYKAIRPTGNKLDGYAPSSAMNRMQEAA